MIDYRYLLPAELEMTEAALFYEEQLPGLGRDYLDDIQRSIDLIRTHPETGQVIRGKFRRGLVSRFPYSIIYSIENDHILILAVAHNRRKPFYWEER
ncbi:MAG: type II toxin-antitoxin system RelE/ParE family toxin [Gammaproteobacteria bacterium]|nr:type II toxin-antitoxin system RelE/ParE family toxin [Gammaproteobacteria bacterium]